MSTLLKKLRVTEASIPGHMMIQMKQESRNAKSARSVTVQTYAHQSILDGESLLLSLESLCDELRKHLRWRKSRSGYYNTGVNEDDHGDVGIGADTGRDNARMIDIIKSTSKHQYVGVTNGSCDI